MRIADVLRNKGAAVVTINPDATVGELLAGLAEQNIGAMVVVGAEGVVGIVSERDVVRQLHTYGASVLSRPVAKIMSTTVATCTKSDTVDKISVLMTENRVRHVPVLDGKKLIGIVSIGDVVKSRMGEPPTVSRRCCQLGASIALSRLCWALASALAYDVLSAVRFSTSWSWNAAICVLMSW